MIIDMQSVVSVEGVIDFPDFVFANLPKQPSNIRNFTGILGNNTTNVAAQGGLNVVNILGSSPPFPGS